MSYRDNPFRQCSVIKISKDFTNTIENDFECIAAEQSPETDARRPKRNAISGQFNPSSRYSE